MVVKPLFLSRFLRMSLIFLKIKNNFRELSKFGTQYIPSYNIPSVFSGTRATKGSLVCRWLPNFSNLANILELGKFGAQYIVSYYIPSVFSGTRATKGSLVCVWLPNFLEFGKFGAQYIVSVSY